MTDLLLPMPSQGRWRSAAALVLGAGALTLGVQTRAAAAPVKAHKQAAHAASPLTHDWSKFESLLHKLQTKIDATPPVQFAHDLGLNGLSGTYNAQALDRLLQGKSPIASTKPTAAAQVLARAAAIHAQKQATPVHVSTSGTSHAAALQVLVAPTRGPSTPVAQAQFTTVPEPSMAAIVLALLGLAGGWRRLRRAGD